MKTEAIKSEMDKMSEELAELTKTFRTKMQGMFSDILEQFFLETPRCKAIVWNQYTPGFNDGDPCTFTIGEVVFLSNEFDEELDGNAYEYDGHDHEIDITASHDMLNHYKKMAEQYKDTSNGAWYVAQLAETQKALDEDDGTISRCNLIKDLINREQDIMEAVFGDNVTVYAIQGKTWTSEYECGY